MKEAKAKAAKAARAKQARAREAKAKEAKEAMAKEAKEAMAKEAKAKEAKAKEAKAAAAKARAAKARAARAKAAKESAKLTAPKSVPKALGTNHSAGKAQATNGGTNASKRKCKVSTNKQNQNGSSTQGKRSKTKKASETQGEGSAVHDESHNRDELEGVLLQMKDAKSMKEGDIVWVKYGRYSECLWPGEVAEAITDSVELLVCRQQGREERIPRKSEEDLENEPVYRIRWFNHHTTIESDIERTENDFFQCELVHFANGFKDNWRRRSHIRVGRLEHRGDFFNRAVYEALNAWQMHESLESSSVPHIARWLGVAQLQKNIQLFMELHKDTECGDSSKHHQKSVELQWNCSACSLINAGATSSCHVCGTQKPQEDGTPETSRLGRANSRKRKLAEQMPVYCDDESDSNISATQKQISEVKNDAAQARSTISPVFMGNTSADFEPTGFLGQGMSGSLTHRSVTSVFERMGLKGGDRFLDLGSGVGNVTLQAAEEIPTLEWSRGIEVIEEAWAEACFRTEKLRKMGRTICPVQFQHADLIDYSADSLPNATHIYVFAAGMPPELQIQLFRLLCNADEVQRVAVVIDGYIGRNGTSLSTLLLKSSQFRYRFFCITTHMTIYVLIELGCKAFV